MRNFLILFCLAISILSCKKDNKTKVDIMKPELSKTKESIHQFSVKDLEGTDFNFADLKGKKIMIVNTASKCGLTPQYFLPQVLAWTQVKLQLLAPNLDIRCLV